MSHDAVIEHTALTMRAGDLTLTGFRDRRGHLRYFLSNNEIVHAQTVSEMLKRDLLELAEPPEEANEKGRVLYRLRV